MTRIFRPTHALALIAALFITSATFSQALTVPVSAEAITNAALA